MHLPKNIKAALEPTGLDRAIAKYAPGWGAKRAKARMEMAMVSGLGGFTGAKRGRRGTQNWNTSSGSADADLLSDLPALRERSRDLVRNTPLAAGAIKTFVTNVVGTGLVPKARAKRTVLGLSDEQADAWNARAEALFRDYALGPYGADITREMSFVDLQQLVLRGRLESGDVLAIRRYTEEDGGLVGFRWQIVEGDRVSNPYGRTDSTTLRAGVERDSQGRVAGYHVQDRHPGDLTISAATRSWTFVPAWSNDGIRRAVLIYGIDRPDQSRGVPLLAPVIETFKQLDQYREAELMAAVITAMITLFVKSSDGEGLGSGAPAGSAGDTTGSESGSDYALGHGAIIDLDLNEDIVNPMPMRPNTAFEGFVSAILQQIGAALELPMSLLIKQFKASYSASRGELLEAWKAFKSMRFSLAQDFCVPTWEAVITELVARGTLAAPGFFEDAEIRAAWLAHDWIGPAPGTLDPLKEVQASREKIEGNLSTHDKETAALDGGDWEVDEKQRRKEFTLINERAGLATAVDRPRDLKEQG